MKCENWDVCKLMREVCIHGPCPLRIVKPVSFADALIVLNDALRAAGYSDVQIKESNDLLWDYDVRHGPRGVKETTPQIKPMGKPDPSTDREYSGLNTQD